MELDAAQESNSAFKMSQYVYCNDLCGQLRAVAGYIKGRSLRKVDMEFFYVKSSESFDSHCGNGFEKKLLDADKTVKPFVEEIQGSEFGRSIPVNSNGGTDIMLGVAITLSWVGRWKTNLIRSISLRSQNTGWGVVASFQPLLGILYGKLLDFGWESRAMML